MVRNDESPVEGIVGTESRTFWENDLYLGEVSEVQLAEYGLMVDRKEMEVHGGYNNVFFVDSHAIRYPIPPSVYNPCKEEGIENIIKEGEISRHLLDNRIYTPKMFIGYESPNEVPFLVMERLDLIDAELMDVRERKALEGEIIKIIGKIQRLGYNPRDLHIDNNWGVDRSNGKIAVFDFGYWVKSREVA